MLLHMWHLFYQFLETLSDLSIVWGEVYELPLHLFSIKILSWSAGNCFIFVFSFPFSSQRCSRLSSCFSELLRLFIVCLLCLFFNISFFSFNYDASFSKISFSFFYYYIWIRIWINAQYDCLPFWSDINSSSWHHSMFSFNFNDFLFCNAIYVLDLSFNGVTQHFCYVRWYSRIVFFNFKLMYITKTRYLSFGPSLNCVKIFILLVHF